MIPSFAWFACMYILGLSDWLGDDSYWVAEKEVGAEAVQSNGGQNPLLCLGNMEFEMPIEHPHVEIK